MKYIVHLREKRTGKVEIEAASQYDAIQAVKNLIRNQKLPISAIDRDGGIVVTFAEEKV